MKKEELKDNNSGVKCNLICIFYILYFSYSVHFIFCIFLILYFSHYAFSVFCIFPYFVFKLHLIAKFYSLPIL